MSNRDNLRTEINIKEYLINRLTLPIIIIFIIATILISIMLDTRALSIIARSFGISSFILLVVVVGTILAYNPQAKKDNLLVKIKRCVSNRVERHKHFKWLQKHRAIEFLLLFLGIIVGLCSLTLELIVTINV